MFEDGHCISSSLGFTFQFVVTLICCIQFVVTLIVIILILLQEIISRPFILLNTIWNINFSFQCGN